MWDDWRDQAACAAADPVTGFRYDPELWFPIGLSAAAILQGAEAKSVCYRCPVVQACLESGMGETDGVYGAMTAEERRKLKRRRQRERLGTDSVQVRDAAVYRMFLRAGETFESVGLVFGLTTANVVSIVAAVRTAAAGTAPVATGGSGRG
jgi:WhiB family redox-sensing transcriptional regulator